ncbi:MAG: MBL fold metallo-hydrolase [Chitinophagaceae bacterium]|nr:MBL fold metallo-hydrolase [Chitinophagaceae bacterium]
MSNENSPASSLYFKVAPGVWGMKDMIVNYYFIQNSDKSWVLVDTGLSTSAPKIKKVAAKLFGENTKPTCIVLTHGHFDHVGSVDKLADEWHVPVYAHYLELPYLTGHASYPPPDPTVGGGMMSALAFLYPNEPIDISNHLLALEDNDKIPGLPDWTFIHTPGHAPGHISLYRKSDGVLIAGDAFVTTQQESLLSVILQSKQISGPPKYFTYDWEQAEISINTLVNLQPKIAATGHGRPISEPELREGLELLLKRFQQVAIPEQGRYVDDPAVADASGFIYVPSGRKSRAGWAWIAAGAALGLSGALYFMYARHKRSLA